MREGWDDEQLLAALREAVRDRQAVPPWFVEMATNAYAWHNVDAELAQLTYDSETDLARAAATRSEAASIRALTFTSPHLTLELEVAENSLIGQIIPPRRGAIEQQASDGETVTAPIDEIGCFYIQPVPTGPFRLRCRTEDGIDVVTNWFTV